jgi:hypothetical protein
LKNFGKHPAGERALAGCLPQVPDTERPAHIALLRYTSTGFATPVNYGRQTIISVPKSFAAERFKSASIATSTHISLPLEAAFLGLTLPQVRGQMRQGDVVRPSRL